MEKLTVSITEASQILGVSRPTVYRLMRREDFPALHIGRRVLISRSGLERWVEEQARGAAEGGGMS